MRPRRSSVSFVSDSRDSSVPPSQTRPEVGRSSPAAVCSRVDRRRLAEVVARVGLEGRLRHRPAQLSGGEQQRVAIARALSVRPAVIFCDEPTGALDSGTAAQVLGLLREAVDRDGATVVMVTHDPVAASYADRVLLLADGRIADDLPPAGAEVIAERLGRPLVATGGVRC